MKDRYSEVEKPSHCTEVPALLVAGGSRSILCRARPGDTEFDGKARESADDSAEEGVGVSIHADGRRSAPNRSRSISALIQSP